MDRYEDTFNAVIRTLAPPQPPAGLADRVLDHVRRATSREHVLSTVPPNPHTRTAFAPETTGETMRSPVKFAATKALAAAAAAIFVVASLAVAVPGGDSGDDAALDTLLTAADATESVGSADVQIVGDAHTLVRLDLEEFLSEVPEFDEMIERLDEALPAEPSEIPDPATQGSSDGPASTGPGLPDLPDVGDLPEIPEPDCTELPQELCEQLRRQLEDARARLERSLENRSSGSQSFDESEFDPQALREQILEEMEARRAEAKERMREHLAEAQARLEEQLSEIPDEFRCDFHFEGSGTMTIPGTVRIAGEADVSCDPDFVAGHGRFDTVLSQDVAFSDNGDGTFTAGPRDGIGVVPADGRSIAELLRKADNAHDGGTEQLDGVTVRHVSFSTQDGPATVHVDVWIGVEDHVVRKIVSRSSGTVDRDGVHAEFEAESTVLVTNVRLDAPAHEVEIPDFEDVVPAPPATEKLDGLTNPFGDPMPAPYSGSEVVSS